MSGHSKWSTIKNKKAKTDQQRGKIFTKIGREIAVAVKLGGPDPNNNSKLKDIIDKAKANNIPNDNIMRSIKKASGETDSVNYEELTYEGYGPNGVAIIIETLTDNKNRTAGEIRHILDKSGGSLGTTGCVSWMFETKGQIIIEKSEVKDDEDSFIMVALEAGALDVLTDDEDVYEILTDPNELSAVKEAFINQGMNLAEAEVQMIPKNTVEITEEIEEKVQRLLDNLEDNDDVQNVFHNAILEDE